jgi:hypothetical protein
MEADNLGPYGEDLPTRLRVYWPTDLVRLVFLPVVIVLLMLWMSLTFDAFDIRCFRQGRRDSAFVTKGPEEIETSLQNLEACFLLAPRPLTSL